MYVCMGVHPSIGDVDAALCQLIVLTGSDLAVYLLQGNRVWRNGNLGPDPSLLPGGFWRRSQVS